MYGYMRKMKARVGDLGARLKVIGMWQAYLQTVDRKGKDAAEDCG